jgi:hypothetical protein
MDRTNGVLRGINVTAAAITTLAGRPNASVFSDGTGTSATFNKSLGVALNSCGSFAFVVCKEVAYVK